MYGLTKKQMSEIEKNTVITRRGGMFNTPYDYHCSIFPLVVKTNQYQTYQEQSLRIDGKIDNVKPFGSQLERYCELYMQYKGH